MPPQTRAPVTPKPQLRRLSIVVDTDPQLIDGLSAQRVAKLRRGITFTRVDDGVQIDGLPGLGGAVTFGSMSDAVKRLLTLADVLAEFATAEAGSATATGRYLSDRAEFLREAARVIVERHRELWP